MILKKLKSFIHEKNFDFRSGDVVATFCGFLACSAISTEAFDTFFNYVYENLKEFKESKSCE